MKFGVSVLLIVLLSVVGFAQNGKDIFPIKYITAETVYLEGGKAKGLNVGDKLMVVCDKKKVVAELEVIYVAEYSASCRIIHTEEPIKPGDLAVVVTRKKQKTPSVETPKTPEPAPEVKPQPTQKTKKPSRSRRSTSRVSGSVSAQYYHWNDQSISNLDFSQPTARFNLRINNLWDKEYQLRIRTRTRYNQRNREYSPDVPQNEWRNRIYELSLSYDNLQAPFNYKVGRIISNYMSGIGYIDGLQLQYNLSSSVRMGIFAGTQPDWRTSDFQTNIQKFGAFWSYRQGDVIEGGRFESTIAAAAEYHSSVVSREFIFLRNSYSYKSRLYIYQSAEVDINRNWRKARAGERFSLTNLFLSARYRHANWLTLGLTFDNRKNYWTYEIRTIEEILFDDAFRRGLRGSISVKLPARVYFYSTVGMRKRETDSRSTYSYSGGIRKVDFLFRRLSVNLNVAGFNNPLSNGYTTSVRLAKSLLSGQRFEIGGGNYAYRGGVENSTRNNQWARFNGYFPLIGRLFLYGQYEYDWGDDIKGQRILTELGYRF